jgi:hypothetical protein
MADRYWVGGTGNWSDTNRWSDTSGGTPGASVPTSIDNVIFDASSNVGTGTFTVTVDGTASAPSICNDFSTGGAGGALDGVMTLSIGATGQLDVYGSMTLPATNLTWTGVTGAAVYFKSTATGKTITTNGVTLTATSAYFDGLGGEWTLGSALTTGVACFFLKGTFSTANFNISCSQFNLTFSGSDVRTVNLGSSTVTITGATMTTGQSNLTGLTFNAGTSTIIGSNANPIFNGQGLTWYNVTFSSTGAGTVTVNFTNTFNNLTFTSRAATGFRAVVFSGNQTINGTLTFGAANTAIRRISVASSIIGTQRTITAATVATIADVDFRDIAAAGTSAPWSGTRLGNCLGNSNITFDAPKTVYRVGTGSWSATQWSLTSGGSVDVNNFPLAQDIMVFDTGTVTGTHTIDGAWQLGSLDCSLLNVAVTIASGTVTPTFYGDITLDADITLTGTGVFTFAGQGVTRNITSAGDVFTQPLTINAPLGTVRLVDNLTTGSTLATTLTAGTLDLNNQTLSTGIFNSSVSNVRTIAFGTGNITITGTTATILNFTNGGANLTLTGSRNIYATNASGTTNRTFNGPLSSATNDDNIFNLFVTGGTDTVILRYNFLSVDLTGFAGTIQNTVTFAIWQNLTIPAGVTHISDPLSSFIAFMCKTTSIITTNAITFNCPIYFGFNTVATITTGTYAFQDAFNQSSAYATTIFGGTVQLKDGVTSTVGAFVTSGTNQKFLQSTTPGSQATLSQASGTVNAQYLTIRDINATGGATWNAFVDQGNIDAGNNDGWDFGISPIVGGNEYTYQLRSFTQPRRF